MLKRATMIAATMVAMPIAAWAGASPKALPVPGDDPFLKANSGVVIRFDPNWPQPLPNNWTLGDVGGVSVDKHDQVWIVHRPSTILAPDLLANDKSHPSKCCAAAPPVLVFNTAGKLIKSWGGPNTTPDWFDSEHSIFVDDNDNVWLVGGGKTDGELLKFDNDGRQLLKIGRKGPFVAADDPTMLGRPTDIYVDVPAHEVYVSDGYRNKRVIVFDSETGAFKRQWTVGGAKVDPGYFRESTPGKDDTPRDHFGVVHCVTMIEDEVHVCDRTNDRVQVFTKAGRFIREIKFNADRTGATGGTWDAIPVPGHPGAILVVDGTNSELGLLDRRSGKVLTSLLAKGNQPGQMHWPHQGAMDREDRIYVAQVGGAKRVARFTLGIPQATFLSAAEIAAVEKAIPVGDRNFKVADLGYENFAFGKVHRDSTRNPPASRDGAFAPNSTQKCGAVTGDASASGKSQGQGITHEAQAEGYYITSGGGTMIVDGYIANGKPYALPELNGPTCIGPAFETRNLVVKEGDVVIIPAGVVHGWSDIPDHVDYISFRPSPGVLEPGWVHPALRDGASAR